jgi:hypothetical protein
MKKEYSVFRFFVLLCLGSILILFTSCRLSDSLITTPLSEREQQFVGSWKHVHGVGNVWNKDFSDNRSLHSHSTNLIWGDSEAYYLWEADYTTLYLYEQDALVLKPEAEYEYSFSGEDLLVIDGAEYERQ